MTCILCRQLTRAFHHEGAFASLASILHVLTFLMAWEHARKFQFGMKTRISQFQLMSIHLNPSSYLQTLRFHRCCVSFFLAYLWPAGPARPSREARFRLEGRWFMTRHPMTSDINTQIAMLKKSLSCHIMLLKLYHANANGFPPPPSSKLNQSKLKAWQCRWVSAWSVARHRNTWTPRSQRDVMWFHRSTECCYASRSFYKVPPKET